jgi:hypothetical protein
MRLNTLTFETEPLSLIFENNFLICENPQKQECEIILIPANESSRDRASHRYSFYSAPLARCVLRKRHARQERKIS